MSARTVRILHITDTHLHATVDSRMRGVNTFETFRAVVDQALADPLRPDAVLATGDLVQDETRAGYELFRDALDNAGCPVYCIPGNHDAPNLMREMLGEPPFQFGGIATLGQWQLILLNSVIRGQDAGRLDDDQLALVEQSLSERPDLHSLLCLHHQPVPMGSRWLDGVGLLNEQALFEIVARHPQVRGIVWGHVHQASDRQRGDIRLISSPSTGSQFLPDSDHFALDSHPPAFRWINLKPDGDIESDVVWLDRT